MENILKNQVLRWQTSNGKTIICGLMIQHTIRSVHFTHFLWIQNYAKILDFIITDGRNREWVDGQMIRMESTLVAIVQ